MSFHSYQASLSIAAGVFGTRAWRSKLTYRLAITKRLSDEELQEEIRARDKANKESDDVKSDDEEQPTGRIRSE